MKYTLADHILYWALPLAGSAVFIISYLMGPETYNQWVMHPMGFTEGFIGGVLLIVIFFGLFILKDPLIWQDKKIRWWLIIYILAVIFFFGEDQSWGMYYREKYFGYKIPEYWLLNNKEQETNLHNMNTWLNQKPRLVVYIWIFVSGILVPLGWKFPIAKTRKFLSNAFWPDKKILPLAVCAAVARMPEAVLGKAIRFSEIQELYFAFFMLMFLVQMYKRAKKVHTL